MDGVRVGLGEAEGLGCLRWQWEYKMRQVSEEDILFGAYLNSSKSS